MTQPRVTLRNFSVLAYAQGFTLWFYRAPNVSAVLAPAYWHDARESITPGDIVHIVSEDRRQYAQLFFPPDWQDRGPRLIHNSGMPY